MPSLHEQFDRADRNDNEVVDQERFNGFQAHGADMLSTEDEPPHLMLRAAFRISVAE